MQEIYLDKNEAIDIVDLIEEITVDLRHSEKASLDLGTHYFSLEKEEFDFLKEKLSLCLDNHIDSFIFECSYGVFKIVI